VIWAVAGWWKTVHELAKSGPTGRTQSPPFAKEAKDGAPASRIESFLAIWAIVPVVFFSFSGSKLPGYILPAVPAWTLLAVMWIARNEVRDQVRTLLIVLHSVIAAMLVAAVIIAPYRTLRVPVSRTAGMTATLAAIALFAGIVITLLRRGTAWLRFVTLVPVVLAVAYILRIDAPALDAKLSARPVAQEIARMETRSSVVAVLHGKRELEYGLNFYRNQPIASYDRAEVPAVDHLVIARAGSESELTELVSGRRVVRLGEFPAQQVEFFWVTRQPAMEHMH
jgi:4-amino-4-deoxy-L-arabinose transferase-like glycosyltransferase